MAILKYQSTKGLYIFRKFIPKNYLQKKSDKHYTFILRDRWSLVSGKKHLDIGCGYGQFARLNPKNIEVYGIDIEKQSDLTNFKIADINKKIPYSDNTFDSITMFHVLEHLTNPSYALKEINRVLKKDGQAIIMVPNYSFKHFYSDHTHIRPYPKKALFDIMNEAGFRNVKLINGPRYYQVISTIFFIFPLLRFTFEKILGMIFPSEINAVGYK